MPSSMIFAGLVVVWLLILVPAVARHRQEVARPSTAALSGRVLERPRPRRGPEQGREPDTARELEVRRRPEVDVMDQVDEKRRVAEVDEDRYDEDRYSDQGHDDRYPEPLRDDRPAEPVPDDRAWERPPPRYRPGRGGFDPEAAALTASARYSLRQRVVLAMLATVVLTAVAAALAVPWLWWVHVAADLALAGYLFYLRRQVRLEEAIRERRAARMAGTRRLTAADDPDLDEWARRGREAVGGGEPRARRAGPDAREDIHRDDRPHVDVERATPPEQDLELDAGPAAEVGTEEGGPDLDRTDELSRERPERVRGTGEPLRAAANTHLDDVLPALPRLQPAPPPPLPAGTALVEAFDDDPALHELDCSVRPDYRRAVGE